MKEWTLEERYRVLQSADEIADLHERITKSVYRQKFHVQPITGLSSDPNGFVYHEGKWHLFYQWTPWGAVHGLKYWYHVISEDLVHWTNAGIGLKPDSFYDNKGTHSGSAISADGELYFFYTGNHRDENWVRTPYTCAAKLGADGKVQKLPEPLFGPRDDYSEHQRDPKVVYNAEKNKYYILIGAQTLDERGTALVYESDQLLEGWKLAGQLHVPGYEKFGGMWECPYIVNISGKDVLIFSPQYTKLPGRGESTNHNVYFIGKMDYDTLTFTPETDYQYLDFGFDFYAAQGAANVDDPDKAILISWIGLPDNHYPTEPEEWEGSMTLPRELRVSGSRLIQTPVAGITDLREEEIPAEGKLPEFGELEATFTGEDTDLNLYTKADGSGGFRIHYDAAKKVATIDRTGMDKRFNENVGEILDMPLPNGLQKFQIFIDCCSVEIFANDGEATFTSHIYPTEAEHNYTLSHYNSLKIWKYKASVKDDFVV
ncbi:MAG: sucrose-6-phosphate hydrolase [Lachnospiraceae bacterium]|nr:sucrose-6-phosphate hydrolase [Lachnospiraceae bacterium]